MVGDRRIRIMVVDDHPVVRDGMREVLNNFSDFDVVGQAGDGAEAVRLAAELRPEVIIMDVLMPEKGGIDACREIMDLLPGTRVLMLTASTAPAAVVESVAAGAAGFLLKDSGVEQLAEAIRQVGHGRHVEGLRLGLMSFLQQLVGGPSTSAGPVGHRAYARAPRVRRFPMTGLACDGLPPPPPPRHGWMWRSGLSL